MHNLYYMGIEKQVMDGPDGRKFYGSVTVGERGQVVIPAQARRDHGFEPGDKLIVLGNREGIALMSADALMSALSASSELMAAIGGYLASDSGSNPGSGEKHEASGDAGD